MCGFKSLSLQFEQCNGKEISWKHLEDLYHRDSGADTEAPGLAMVPKLKYEHIHLSSFSKMRVDLAAQECRYRSTHLHVCLSMYFHLLFTDG